MQDWTERFSGLWQTQAKDFLLEKAFNQLVGGGGTCCVCSLLAPTNPYKDFDPSHLRQLRSRMCESPRTRRRRSPSLTVVVQRALVSLPEHLSATGSDDEEDSKLLTCQSCQICVHKCECLGLLTLVSWLLVCSGSYM